MVKKHSRILAFYTMAGVNEPDPVADFDTRTLASLVNTADGGRPTVAHDGNNEDDPYQTLPLLRPTLASQNKWRNDRE